MLIESTSERIQLASEYIGYKPDRRFARTQNRRKKYEIGQLWDIHHEIIRRVSLGDKGADIARDLGVTPTMVSYTRNSRIAQDKIEIMRGAMDADTVDLGIRIKNLAPKALDLLEQVIGGNGSGKEATIGLRVGAAKDMLDRAGFGAVKKTMGLHAHLSPEDIERIKQRARMSMSPIVVSGEEDGETG